MNNRSKNEKEGPTQEDLGMFSLMERVKSGRVYVVCKHDEDLGYVRTYAIQLENGKGENVEKEFRFIKILQFII